MIFQIFKKWVTQLRCTFTFTFKKALPSGRNTFLGEISCNNDNERCYTETTHSKKRKKRRILRILKKRTRLEIPYGIPDDIKTILKFTFLIEDEFAKYNQNYKTGFTFREVQQLLIYLETCLLGRCQEDIERDTLCFEEEKAKFNSFIESMCKNKNKEDHGIFEQKPYYLLCYCVHLHIIEFYLKNRINFDDIPEDKIDTETLFEFFSKISTIIKKIRIDAPLFFME